MAKYPAHFDVQDRLISKYTKKKKENRNKLTLEEQNDLDPSSLTLKEQLELEQMLKKKNKKSTKTEYNRYANGFVDKNNQISRLSK